MITNLWEKIGHMLGAYSGGDAGYLRMADHYCIYAEGNLVHSVPDSAVR